MAKRVEEDFTCSVNELCTFTEDYITFMYDVYLVC